MSDLLSPDQSPWQTTLRPMGCAVCKQSFLAEPARLNQPCPHCARGTLTAQPARVRAALPELVMPLAFRPADLRLKLQPFVDEVWLKPPDFTVDNLVSRAVPVFWPMWLVDATVHGQWQAEVGFDYQVKSTQEHYDGGWRTREVVETRIRWEPRLGELTRPYHNVAVAALTGQPALTRALGEWPAPAGNTTACTPASFAGTAVRLPDIPPESAQAPAHEACNALAAQECATAAGAQHVRQASFRVSYLNPNWTLLLFPLYTTYYTDEAGQRHAVWVHGRTGRVAGRRVASSRGAQTWGLSLGCGGLVVLALAVLLILAGALFPPLAVLGGLIFLAGLGVGLAGLIPALWAWQWNTRQPPDVG